MNKRRVIVFSILFQLILAGFGHDSQSRAMSNTQLLLQNMTLEQKIGQMFMITQCGQGMPEASEKFIREIQPGGVALFTCNGTTPEEVTDTVNAWQNLAAQIGSRSKLIVAIDQEGGPVKRLPDKDGYAPLPAGWAIGAMPAKDAEIVGKVAAEELRAVGINMNLAPVADVQTVISNPVMDRRTFGSFPENVALKASAYATGLQSNGVISVLKHFPGHGDADDSHTLLPVIDYSRERVNQLLEPFKTGIKSGVEAIMIGHLVYPSLDPEKRPASLSQPIVTGMLRKELGFQGLIMTDAMDMGAIVDHYAKDKASVMAVIAGIDMIVTGPHMPAGGQYIMYRALIDAVQNGTIPESRIDESALRILNLKEKYGINNWQALNRQAARARLDSDAHAAQLAQVWRNTATIAANPKKLLPLSPSARTLLVFPAIYPSISRTCQAYDPKVKTYGYSQQVQSDEIANAVSLARNADVIIIFTYDAVNAPTVRGLVNALPAEKTVVAAIQSPYDLTLFPGVAGSAASYMPYPAAFEALCGVIYGVIPAKGMLPIGL